MRDDFIVNRAFNEIRVGDTALDGGTRS